MSNSEVWYMADDALVADVDVLDVDGVEGAPDVEVPLTR